MAKQTTFTKNLKLLRKKHGLTQQAFADEFEITISRYGAWEEGRAEPCIEMYLRVCGYYGVSPTDMYETDLKQTT